MAFYVESQLIVSEEENTNNHSPVLLEMPIDVGYVDQPFMHTPNAFDADGDSLVYELVEPLWKEGYPVPKYQEVTTIEPGPDNRLSFDPATGLLIWDAPQLAGVYNIAIRIKAFRNGQLVDQVLRDMQIIIYEDDNNPPEFRQPLPDSILTLLPGEQLQLAVEASDPDENQQITILASSDLFAMDKSAVFELEENGNSAIGLLKWTPGEEDVRQQPYQIVFKAKDNYRNDGLATIEVVRVRVQKARSTSVSIIDIRSELRLFPNPVTSDLFLMPAGDQFNREVQRVLILGADGRLLKSEHRGIFSFPYKISVRDLPSGAYFLLIQGRDFQGTLPFKKISP